MILIIYKDITRKKYISGQFDINIKRKKIINSRKLSFITKVQMIFKCQICKNVKKKTIFSSRSENGREFQL